MYLRCAALSALQQHPFTLASVAASAAGGQQQEGLVHIKVQGPWTRGLRELAARGQGLSLQVGGRDGFLPGSGDGGGP